MKPEQENEILKTIRLLKNEIKELKELVTPIAPNKNKFLNTKEACAMIKCSRAKLYRLMNEGIIPYEQSGKIRLLSEYELIKYINR